jgi:glycosyltransferase involved in cell wall biosynthesis
VEVLDKMYIPECLLELVFEVMNSKPTGQLVHDAKFQPDSINSDPFISVVVAAFNSVEILGRCINSVEHQTYSHKELLVIDGGSKDGTVELLEANSQKISYWISELDHGIYHAWNKALPCARGEWICFLGADDYFWDATVLGRISEQLRILPPNIRVVYGQNMLVNARGESLYSMGESWDTVKARFWTSMCLPHPGMMHHRSLFEEHGPFNESFRIAGDYEMLLRELKRADALFIPNLIIAGVRQGGISSHPDAARLVLSESRRAQRMHGQRFPSLLWLRSVAKVYLRYLLWRLFGERVARRALDLGRHMFNRPRYWTKT